MDLENSNYNTDLTFYTLADIEETLRSVSNKRGFLGIMDNYSHISYENFDDIYIFSKLKCLNSK